MPNEDFRAEQDERRQHGLQKRHEQRLENATYTAAEVKVLTAKARQETAEEIAQELLRSDSWIMHPDHPQVLIPRAAAVGIAREVGSKETL